MVLVVYKIDIKMPVASKSRKNHTYTKIRKVLYTMGAPTCTEVFYRVSN